MGCDNLKYQPPLLKLFEDDLDSLAIEQMFQKIADCYLLQGLNFTFDHNEKLLQFFDYRYTAAKNELRIKLNYIARALQNTHNLLMTVAKKLNFEQFQNFELLSFPYIYEVPENLKSLQFFFYDLLFQNRKVEASFYENCQLLLRTDCASLVAEYKGLDSAISRLRDCGIEIGEWDVDFICAIFVGERKFGNIREVSGFLNDSRLFAVESNMSTLTKSINNQYVPFVNELSGLFALTKKLGVKVQKDGQFFVYVDTDGNIVRESLSCHGFLEIFRSLNVLSIVSSQKSESELHEEFLEENCEIDVEEPSRSEESNSESISVEVIQQSSSVAKQSVKNPPEILNQIVYKPPPLLREDLPLIGTIYNCEQQIVLEEPTKRLKSMCRARMTHRLSGESEIKEEILVEYDADIGRLSNEVIRAVGEMKRDNNITSAEVYFNRSSISYSIQK